MTTQLLFVAVTNIVYASWSPMLVEVVCWWCGRRCVLPCWSHPLPTVRRQLWVLCGWPPSRQWSTPDHNALLCICFFCLGSSVAWIQLTHQWGHVWRCCCPVRRSNSLQVLSPSWWQGSSAPRCFWCPLRSCFCARWRPSCIYRRHRRSAWDVHVEITSVAPRQGRGGVRRCCGKQLVGTFMANEEIMDDSKVLMGTSKSVQKIAASKLLWRGW